MTGLTNRRDFLTAMTASAAVAALPDLGIAHADRLEGPNIIANGDFSQGELGGLPSGWNVVCPNPALQPSFKLTAVSGGERALAASGNGRSECFGYIRHPVRLSAGKHYSFRVVLESESLEDLNAHLVHGVFDSKFKFNDGIVEYTREGSSIIGKNRFPGPDTAMDAEVRLYFRFSPHGTVRWRQVSLLESDGIPARPVTLACRDGHIKGQYAEILAYSEKWLDVAGQKKVDVALLPEIFNGRTPFQAEPLNGPTGTLLARKARQWGMYVCASFYERRGDLVYNTAPLYGRDGALVGTYEKNNPYDPEMDEGVTPGTKLPVFTTDFGKVGIQICYDNWFPEVARVLGYSGAELILYPNEGYYPELMPARASDSGVWFAVSSQNQPAGVWDSGGARAGGELPGLCDATSILSCQRVEEHRMLITTVDLSRRYSPAWNGGPMESAPGGRRVRRTRMDAIEGELAREAARWCST